MKNFCEIIKLITDYTKETLSNGSINQLVIKNYDQLYCISAEDEIKEIQTDVSNIITETLKNKCKFKIFEYDKFYYIISDIDSKDIILDLAGKIHANIITGLASKQFVDTRIISTTFSENSDILSLIRILSDHIHYNFESNVFSWIDDTEKFKQKLLDDYLHLREIRDGIHKNEACFAFQPIVECATGKIAYHECLLRLNNKDYKLISAGPYIMLAEKYGYISTVDKYVFDMALKELEHSSISLSINLSNIGVQDLNLHNHFFNELKNSNVANRLTIEITETAMNNDFRTTIKFIESMKSLGVKIALDDFGDGYTSYSQVRNLPIDILKIDGSYVRDIHDNPKNRAIVESFIRTAEDFACKTVAEYVENGLVAKELIELKVDYMQGDFFSPAKNYRSWEKS